MITGIYIYFITDSNLWEQSVEFDKILAFKNA